MLPRNIIVESSSEIHCRHILENVFKTLEPPNKRHLLCMPNAGGAMRTSVDQGYRITRMLLTVQQPGRRVKRLKECIFESFKYSIPTPDFTQFSRSPSYTLLLLLRDPMPLIYVVIFNSPFKYFMRAGLGSRNSVIKTPCTERGYATTKTALPILALANRGYGIAKTALPFQLLLSVLLC